MYKNNKVIVVMPAYNAAQTLRITYDEVIAQGVVDLVIIVDDGSHDETVKIARTLPNARLFIHSRNRGYGANQKTCYKWRWRKAAILSSWFIPITNTHRN